MKKISDTVANKLALYPKIDIDENSNIITVTVKKSPIPVDLNGKFYIRSGNAVHEARGREYDHIVSKRLNISWIDQPVDGLDESYLDKTALQYFRSKAEEAGIISEANLSISDSELLIKLGLKVGDSITRSGIILFHSAPEDVITGSFTKIGMFEKSEVLYQDVIGGPLVKRLDRIIDILSTKYLVKPITYDGWARVENDQYPVDSLRECIVNALVHNDYSSFNPVQIRVWSDRMMISDSGGLPDGWTIERLLSEHRSEPHNPKIAYVFFLMGFIENWGRGIERVLEGYENRGEKKVTFDADRNFFEVKLDALITLNEVKNHENPTINEELSREIHLLTFMDNAEGRSMREISDMLKLSSTSTASRMYVRPLIDEGKIEYVLPDKPTSKNQRYRTTEIGRQVISHQK